MLALLQKLLIFVVLMLVGYVGARRGTFGPDFSRAASRLTLNVFMSASILQTSISDPPDMNGGDLAYALLVAFLVLLLSYVVSALITRLLPLRRDRAPLFEMLVSAMNPMFIGVPVAEILLGTQGIFYIALSNVFFNLLIYTYGVWRMLGRVSLLDAFREKSLYLVAALRLLLMPLLTWLMFLVLPADPVLRGAMLILSACPSGVIVSILSIQYGKDAEYCSKGILLDTALSMLTIPLMAWLLMGYTF